MGGITRRLESAERGEPPEARDTPKVYTIEVDGAPTRVVGAGSRNGGFYVLDARTGRILRHTPIYTGPPAYPLVPEPDRRMLALPSAIGGLQTGCATDGKTIFTNGIDALRLGSQEKMAESAVAPTGGRVVALSLDLGTERWRHERPRIPSLGGPPPKPVHKDAGDPPVPGARATRAITRRPTPCGAAWPRAGRPSPPSRPPRC